ncbi:transglutaminase TgpA family protein [Chitinilyticum litopenaei]|uniref:transglutaminase TgpA family protein n=1 Tax=Chitinilyticum litopenaei TaxID=1121276 RepID=UPI0004191B7C|nr:DUF3488 and transglutaminase-like domain-containing protein [Chitinilyticum litopenaei]
MKTSPTLTAQQQLEMGVLTALISLPHLLSFGGWLAILLGILLAIHIGRAHARQPLLARWLVWLMAATTAFVVWKELGSLVGQDGGLAIFTSLVVLKTFEARTRRDGRLVVLLCFFSAGGQFLHEQTPLMALSSLLAIGLTLLCALRIENPAGGLHSQARLTGLLCLEAIPLAILLFVMFPRLPGPLWRMPAEPQAISGLSDKVLDPGSISEMATDESVAFRAEFSGAEPARSQLYWRGPVFGLFDGQRWLTAPPVRAPAEPLSRQLQTVSYSVTLEAHQQRWLLALDVPTSPPGGAWMTPARQVLATQNVDKRINYQLTSALDWASAEQLVPEDMLILPAGSNPRAEALAASWRGLPASQRVQRGLLWLQQNGFRYTLNPPKLTSQQPIDEFLFSSKRGFCEHYASSYAFLMRAAGVPARVITGYLGGQKNETGNYYIVRQADAHAWVEVWLAGRGWQRVDPTAVIAPARIQEGLAQSLPANTELPLMLQSEAGWLKGLRMQSDALMYLWNNWVVQYDARRQLEVLRKLKIPDVFSWEFLAGLVGGIALILFAGFLLASRWPFAARAAKDADQQLYARFCRLLGKRGHTRLPHEGPADFARRVTMEWPQAAAQVSEFTQLYIRARYGVSPGPEDRKRQYALLRGLKRLPANRTA